MKPGDKIGLNEIMKRAQEMQKKLQEIQKQVAELEVVGKSGGGAVQVRVNGQHFVREVKIDPNILKEEPSIIEDLIMAAVNSATEEIEKILRDKMGGLGGAAGLEGFGA
jgi:hypothetical protein